MTELEYVGTFPFSFHCDTQDMEIGFRVCAKCTKEPHLEHFGEHDDGTRSVVPVLSAEQALWGIVALALMLMQNRNVEGWNLMKSVVEWREAATEVLEKTAEQNRGRMH